MSTTVRSEYIKRLMEIAPLINSDEVKQAAEKLEISTTQVYKYLQGKVSGQRNTTAIDLLTFLAPIAKARKESLKKSIA